MSRIQFKDIRLAVLSVILGGILGGAINGYSVNQFYEEELEKYKKNEEELAELMGTDDSFAVTFFIKQLYYEKIEDHELINRMIKGIDDEYIKYYSKEQVAEEEAKKKSKKPGEFTGFGLAVYKRNNDFLIRRPLNPNTPAGKAGLKMGDSIIKINNKPIRNISDDELKKSIYTEEIGVKVDLTVLPANSSSPIQVQLISDSYKSDDLRYLAFSELLEKDYGYIKYSGFTLNTEEFVSHINKLYEQNKSPLKGIIVDLRNNPGGLGYNAIGVSGVFLPKESVVYSDRVQSSDEKKYKEFTGRVNRADYMPSEVYPADQKDVLSDLPENIKNVPLVVLINSDSASASEIVAAALQDHKRAVIVGEQSYGKGVNVPKEISLPSGARLEISNILIFSPNHRSWHKQGIVPDIELKNDEPKIVSDKEIKDEEIIARIIQARQDKQLNKALEVLKNPSLYQASIGLAEKEGRIDRKKIVEEK